jgi:hypothetical protein
MIKNKNKVTAIGALVLVGCFVATILGTGLSSATTDWTSVSGSTTSPWTSDATSPLYTDGLNILWSDIGTVPDESNMGTGTWTVPSTAISVGNYAYFYDELSSQIRKANINDGTIAATASLMIPTSMYNVPITYGNGKLFVPVLSGSSITVKIYNADSLAYIGQTDTSIAKAQGMQGAVTYNNGYIYFGTYGSSDSGSDFACFSENGVFQWGINGGSWSYMMAPLFETVGGTTYCIIASEGYGSGSTDGGSTIYVVNPVTGSIYTSKKISSEYCVGGLAYYNDRVYISTENSGATVTHLHSYVLGTGGTLLGEKVWTSSLTGGTQSVPVIYNNRIYLGSGGATMGPARYIEVISIGIDGSMSTIYSIPILTKATLSLTTAYATSANDYTVYLYCTPYDGTGANPDVYIIEDSANQVVAKYRGIELTGDGDQYSYQSVAITSQGYLLIKNDETLWCCQGVSVSSSIGDVNCNGAVSIADVVTTAQYLAHMMQMSDYQLNLADANGNGYVSIADVVRMAQYLAHYDVTLGS